MTFRTGASRRTAQTNAAGCGKLIRMSGSAFGRLWAGQAALAGWLLAAATLPALAADVTVQGSAIRIKGRIEAGDAQKLEQLLATPQGRQAFVRSGTFLLDSRGGRVSEALKIAKIVERGFGTTVVLSGAQCYSACFIVYAAGSYRVAGEAAALGVHRVGLADGRDDDSVAAALARANDEVKSYLQSRGMPAQVIEQMMRTPPHDLFQFGNRWILDQGLETVMTRHPEFMSRVDQHCGTEPATPAPHRAWLDCMAQVRSRTLVAAW